MAFQTLFCVRAGAGSLPPIDGRRARVEPASVTAGTFDSDDGDDVVLTGGGGGGGSGDVYHSFEASPPSATS